MAAHERAFHGSSKASCLLVFCTPPLLMRIGATLCTALSHVLSLTTGGHDSELVPASSCSILLNWSMLLRVSWLEVVESLERSLTSAMPWALLMTSSEMIVCDPAIGVFLDHGHVHPNICDTWNDQPTMHRLTPATTRNQGKRRTFKMGISKFISNLHSTAKMFALITSNLSKSQIQMLRAKSSVF